MIARELLKYFKGWDWCHCCGRGYWHEQVGTDQHGVLKFTVVKCDKHWKEEMHDKVKQNPPRTPSLVRAVQPQDSTRASRDGTVAGRSTGATLTPPPVVGELEDAGDTLGRAIRDFGIQT